MNTHADKTQEKKNQPAANVALQGNFNYSHPESITQQKLQAMVYNSPQMMQMKAFQVKVDRHVSLETGPVVQAQFTPQTRKYLGFEDTATEWLDETIGNVVMYRVNNMNYTKTDGDNTGSIKHYVPYHWIMKNIADNHVIGYKRHTVIANIASILSRLDLDLPGSYPSNPADFDALIRDSVYLICDWEENLFRHSDSSGDGGGSRLDTPNDPGVLARVQVAKTTLGSLANPPLS